MRMNIFFGIFANSYNVFVTDSMEMMSTDANRPQALRQLNITSICFFKFFCEQLQLRSFVVIMTYAFDHYLSNSREKKNIVEHKLAGNFHNIMQTLSHHLVLHL